MNKNFYIFILFLFSNLCGQFGKNIVQYDNFDWSYIQTRHFDIYYYDEGEGHAEFVAESSESAYQNISSKLNWKLKNRVSIIVYNSHNDFQQTNVIDSYLFEGVGGVTELYKNRVVIPFDGSNREFHHVIHHELVHAFINDCVYGGSLKNMISSPIKVNIPGWMNEGLAEYLASGWDTKSDMWMRDLAINGGEFPDINMLVGYMAYRGGQSVWRFICNKWGEESISEIIYQIKQKNGINAGIKEALGVSMKELNNQWHDYLKKTYWVDINHREKLQDMSFQLTNHIDWKNSYNIAPAISPDGNSIAILSNKSGPMSIYLISAEDGKVKDKVIQGERSSEFEEMHILKPGITWSPNSREIAFSAKSGESDALYIVNTKTFDKQKFRLNMEGIFRPAWSPDGNSIAFIGNNGINSDIYIFDIKSESLTNLTNDWYSDDHVSWMPDSQHLLFISDRDNELTIGNSALPQYYNVEQYDIYKIAIDSKEIQRITDTPSDESYPVISSDGESLAFISDESGIANIYIKDDKYKKPVPITNTLTGITQLSWTGDDSQLIFTGFYERGYDIFTLSNPKHLMHLPKDITESKWISEDFNRPLIRKYDQKMVPFSRTEKYQNYIFSSDENINWKDSSNVAELPDSHVKDKSGKYRSHPYRTRFTLDLGQMVASYDSYYGTQAMAYFIFSDIMGDHRIYIATEPQIQIKDSDYLLMYRYLKNKIDWNFAFYNNSYLRQNNNSNNLYSYIRIRTLGLNISGMRPLSRFNRFEASVNFNYNEKAELNYIENSLTNEYDETIKEQFNTLIPSIKYVWDNTLWSHTYPIEGSRVYLKYKTSPDLFKDSKVFQQLSFDFRSYKSITNGISLGGRMFAGTNWGRDPQNFRMGGVPWIASSDENRIHDYGEDVSIEELYFSEYLFPLRGVEISNRLGNNAMLFNFELRLPFLIYYFPTIKFLGQINGVIFVDMGVAWGDKAYPAYWKEESWDKSSPTGWAMSYGLGPRFIFLGMPWKLDYAWEYNPHKGTISNRKWYLSIGLDF